MDLSSTPFRTRLASATIAFSVVTGGFLLAAGPAAADTVETPASPVETTTETSTTDTGAAPAPAAVDAVAAAVTGPTSLAPGGFGLYSGTGFTPGEAVDIVLGDTALPSGPVVAEDGSFTAEVSVPATMGAGTYTLQFTSTGGGAFATVEVTVTDEAVASVTGPVTATAAETAAPGLTYSGTGFTPNEQVTLLVDGQRIDGEVVADDTGAFTLDFVASPALTPGTHVLQFASLTGDATAEIVLEVTGETVLEPWVLSGADSYGPTDPFTYEIGGFAPGSKIDVVVTGPYGGEFTIDFEGPGSQTGEISYYEVDAVTGERISRIDWLPGTYDVTFADRETGTVLTLSYTVGGSSTDDDDDDSSSTSPGASTPANPAPANPGTGAEELATTGAADVFGIAGLGLVLATAGVVAISVRRRMVGDDA